MILLLSTLHQGLNPTKTIPFNITALDQTYVYNDFDKANFFNTYFHSVYTPSPVGAPNIDSPQSVSNSFEFYQYHWGSRGMFQGQDLATSSKS